MHNPIQSQQSASMSNKAGEETVPRSMREIVQNRFSEEVIGNAAATGGGEGWMVLVMDAPSTRVISSALTMYDIMEQRITLVEQLMKSRQPFKEMDVVYVVSPSAEAATAISEDFENDKKAKYAGVHVYFLDLAGDDVLEIIQRNGTLCSRIKTFKEINLDFVSSESNVFHFDMPLTLPKLLGHAPDSNCPKVLGEKLATTCITLNEFPSIRYQTSSRFATEMATTVVKILSDFKQANAKWWCNGEGDHQERERGNLLVLDRSFDPISPLMHEYTYQTMVNDLLPIKDGVISYKAEQNKGSVEKQVLLNENDDLWVEFRHFHIAKVIEIIKERMADIIQNNAGAALHKNSGADMSITKMAAAVKELPEYRETMSKLGQHVNIAQQCMDAFHTQGLMDISQLEQTMSTGVDEEGKAFVGQELVQMLGEAVSNPQMSKVMKIRLLAIFAISQRNGSADDRSNLIRASGLTGAEQQILLNFEKIGSLMQTASTDKKKGNSIISMFRGKAAPKHAATAEGDYADTRHVCRLKVLLEQLMNNELPTADFGAAGPAAGGSGDGKSSAKSVRRYGANSRWGRRDQTMFSGGRYMVFIAGGVAHNELRTGHDLMTQHTKEVIIGGSHIISPNTYIHDVAALHTSSIAAMDLFL